MSENTLLSERQLRECVIGLVQREKIHLPSSSSDFDIVQSFGLQIVDGDLPLEKDGAYIESESKIVLSCEISSAERRRFTLTMNLFTALSEEMQTYTLISMMLTQKRNILKKPSSASVMLGQQNLSFPGIPSIN
jgi:hypothetical protein